ncbi:MAG: phosphoribosyltransferase family protein [Candidatus Sericytochromatia bacterium]|nr:phosphoribosyltransferase family protein [Candidatus Sericytochromatia bacterium]
MERSEACYASREEAGHRLAATVGSRLGAVDLVVGAARGGMLVAWPVAKALGVPLDVRVVRKIGAPGQPERALGAVLPDGAAYWLEGVSPLPQASARPALADAFARQAREREALYRTVRPRLAVKGRRVLLVDDGAATGATLLALIASLRGEGAATVLLTLPVAPPETVSLLEAHVEELWVPEQPRDLWAVGMAYAAFPEVSDIEVLNLLREAQTSGHAPEAA